MRGKRARRRNPSVRYSARRLADLWRPVGVSARTRAPRVGVSFRRTGKKGAPSILAAKARATRQNPSVRLTWWSKRGSDVVRVSKRFGNLKKAQRFLRSEMRKMHVYPSAWTYESLRRNPSLELVLPNRRGKRRNPAVKGRNRAVKGGQRLSGLRIVSASEARTFPGFAKNLAAFRRFHGRNPTHFTRVRLEDGSPHVHRRAVVMVGEAPALEYRTWRYMRSSKSHTRDGRRIVWRHKMGEDGGRAPYLVHDAVSGVTSLLGGTYRVKDFYYH